MMKKTATLTSEATLASSALKSDRAWELNNSIINLTNLTGSLQRSLAVTGVNGRQEKQKCTIHLCPESKSEDFGLVFL